MTYLVIFYCATAGQNGPLLGSDEEEIVLLFYLVLDTLNNKVSFLLFFKVGARGFDSPDGFNHLVSQD